MRLTSCASSCSVFSVPALPPRRGLLTLRLRGLFGRAQRLLPSAWVRSSECSRRCWSQEERQRSTSGGTRVARPAVVMIMRTPVNSPIVRADTSPLPPLPPVRLGEMYGSVKSPSQKLISAHAAQTVFEVTGCVLVDVCIASMGGRCSGLHTDTEREGERERGRGTPRRACEKHGY